MIIADHVTAAQAEQIQAALAAWLGVNPAFLTADGFTASSWGSGPIVVSWCGQTTMTAEQWGQVVAGLPVPPPPPEPVPNPGGGDLSALAAALADLAEKVGMLEQQLTPPSGALPVALNATATSVNALGIEVVTGQTAPLINNVRDRVNAIEDVLIAHDLVAT